MALKLRVSLVLAFATSILTILVGFSNGIATTAILYRTLVSLVLFSVLGYICGQFAERFLQQEVDKPEMTGQNLDIIANVDQEAELPVSEFKPLSPDNFENITLTQK